MKSKLTNNPVNHPAHYTSHPSGIEAIDVCGYMDFPLGNAYKYMFRFESKWSPTEDLKKARWYINRAYFQRTGKLLQNKIKGHTSWDFDFGAFGHGNIVKVVPVGSNPGDVEKALFYVWAASDNSTTDLYLLFIRYARFYLDKEITKRKIATKRSSNG
jgi:hypothetical protein